MMEKSYPRDGVLCGFDFDITKAIDVGDKVLGIVWFRQRTWLAEGEQRDTAKCYLSAKDCRHLSKEFLKLADEIEYWKKHAE